MVTLWRICLSLAGLAAFALPALARRPSPSPHAFGNPAQWQWAPTRAYHVVHYKLALRFDGPSGEVLGDEIVTIRPFNRHFRRFYLDSAQLTIDSVALAPSGRPSLPLRFKTEPGRLWITLDRDYGAGATLAVRIDYHGFPRTGLFFVNPTAAYPDWPREVFSQGEPELNHYWFPCWDYPNDMATSETITTVPTGQMVVSNGRLVKVTRAAGETTFDWRESVPHSSYLISIAVGPWRKIADHYGKTPVDYYVPRTVSAARARRSFHLTPDMIEFFSRATGLAYPYEQYAQTTVHNYIFGGQENVSATTLTDTTLHDARADADYPSTDLVSHELGQEWFGDYVQGRDWADIWVNEGFATYLSALYTQHHEGNESYRYEIYQDQRAALAEEGAYARPLVDRHYTDPLQMFDATTHAKGAAVLEMLRYLVDGAAATARPASQSEPFFRALHHYLVAHAARTADTADVLDAIRATTGRELGWFFREWVYMAGHPDYCVGARYDAARRVETVTIAQTQPSGGTTSEPVVVFAMPIELAFHGAAGQAARVQVRDDRARQQFEIPLAFRPLWVDFDPHDFIEKTVDFGQPIAALSAAAERDPAMMSRLWAVQQLGRASAQRQAARSAQGLSELPREAVAALRRVLASDRFYAVRAAAATSLGALGGGEARALLLAALKQPDSRVRAAAVGALANWSGEADVSAALVGV
ncbi:MAG: M1 family aminopeptidase, partial [Terriglobales bacterium]